MTTPTELTLPSSPDAARCYQELKKAGSSFQTGFQEAVEVANAKGPFAERFAKVIDLHTRTIEAGRVAPTGPMMQEDVYLCCFYDLLEGWVGMEAARVVAAKGAPLATQQALDALLAPIDALPWSSPKWSSIEKPRLKKLVSEAHHPR